jgi:hypothetical protein
MSEAILGLMINPLPADLILPATLERGALYLGSVNALTPRFLKKHNIHVIISMKRVPKMNGGLYHYQFPLPDHRSANPQMQQILPSIISLIDTHRKTGHNVLVHCHAGIHRAPTVVSHYIQKYEGHTVNSSIKLIRSVRPIAFYDGNTFDLRVKK